jgi:LmbE family N-acetylglucosaminyl deacetylase
VHDVILVEPVWRRVNPPLVHVLDSVVGHVARDVTASSSYRSCLVLSPHPDDETLGCAVTIMRKLAAGTPVNVVLATDGGLSPSGYSVSENCLLRLREFRDACHVLGLTEDQTRMLHFRDGSLHLAGEELVDAIADLVHEIGPDEIMTTSPADPHYDHAALGRAALTALSGTTARVLTFPVWQQARLRHWRRAELAYRRPEAVRTGEFLERKYQAIVAYGSQFPGFTRQGVEAGGDMDSLFLRQFLGTHEMFFPIAWNQRHGGRPGAL